MREHPLLLCWTIGTLWVVTSGTSWAQAPATVAAQPPLAMAEVQLVAESMCCQGCARKVAGQLYTVRGVKQVDFDLASHQVTVTLPEPDIATLGQLWQAVECGTGTPNSLTTTTATYHLEPLSEDAAAPMTEAGKTTQRIVLEQLDCEGCARKVAAQLYTLQGVREVRFDLPQKTLLVQTAEQTPPSPWQVLQAVVQAKERPLMLQGDYGTLSIDWKTADWKTTDWKTTDWKTTDWKTTPANTPPADLTHHHESHDHESHDHNTHPHL